MPDQNQIPGYRRLEIMVPLIAAIITAIGVIIAAYIGIIPVIDQELATVQGIVTDNDGEPVIGALVGIDGSSDTTDSDGGYVIQGVPINTKTITVRASGAEVFRRALSIPKGAELITYDITLPPVTPRSTTTPTTQITPTTTPSPTSSPTPTPRATTMATPTPWPTPTPTPRATTMPTPTSATTSTPTPTVTPTPTPMPPVSVEITYPIEEVYRGIENEAEVGGTISRALEEGEEYLWVALGLPGQWYPQENGPIEPSGLNWATIVYIAGSSIGTEIEVAVLIADDELNSKLMNYIQEQGEWYVPYDNDIEIEENIKASVSPIFRGYPPIILTYHDFDLNDVCTPEDNYCGWANAPGKAVVYGSMTTDINVPEGASELEVTISISCNGYGEGLSGQPNSSANIRVDSEERAERIDSTMPSHHGNYYKYEWCDTFSNTFNVRGGEEITLIIEMSGGARLDFDQAELTFS